MQSMYSELGTSYIVMPIYSTHVVVVITFTLEIHRETIFSSVDVKERKHTWSGYSLTKAVHNRVDTNIERKLQDNEQDIDVSGN